MLHKNVPIAYKRISKYLLNTPIISSDLLDEWLGHRIYFKLECLQKTGAFKVRGVLNHLLTLMENNQLPKKISAYSTGNHGIAISWAAKKLNISARIYLPKDVNIFKIHNIQRYGAEIFFTESRQEAENLAFSSCKEGFHFIPPSDNDDVILGSSTLYYESINQIPQIDAIFASCGGGGLISGGVLAKKYFNSQVNIFTCEPEVANDAYLSLVNDDIFRFTISPQTIADGLKTLGISKKTFSYLKQVNGIFLIPEDDILYWTILLTNLLKITCEPSSAISMAAAQYWLSHQTDSKKILIIISGGNIDLQLFQNNNFLLKQPNMQTTKKYVTFIPHRKY